jgi:two-component system CheB/CheR fusion protein
VTENADLDRLLEYLRSQRGFDFTGYKRPSVERRIGKRMIAVGVDSHADYMDYLEVHPDEFPQLFDTILINVTAFFRDPEAWDALVADAIGAISEARGKSGLIRVWSAGCASGEEAYTAAIVLAEALGEDTFERRVKIYATDADEDALSHARHGVYSPKDLETVPESLRAKYFETVGSRFSFRKDLRRSVIFGRHDLVQDAPISRLDLLICRNTLMYFNSELQARILRNFHFALIDTGFLMLGKAETLGRSDLFTPVDLRQRLFTKVPRSFLRDRAFGIDAAGRGREVPAGSALRDAAIEAVPIAQILVDVDGSLVVANEQARALFDLRTADIGRPLQDLELSYRPIELRSRIDAAYAERKPVIMQEVERMYGSGEIQDLDITVAPVFDEDGEALGVLVSFGDVTRYRRLRQQLERSKQDLETAYEELQSSNEELETTNEELQSTVEELETTNEELQSANEELETTNEELQSTNAEIGAMNEDMLAGSLRLNDSADLAQAVVGSFGVAVIVVDRSKIVQTWSLRAMDLWGLRPEEVIGRPLSSLDSGMPVDRMEDAVNTGLSGEQGRVTVEVRDRLGRDRTLEIICNPLLDAEANVVGTVIVMDDAG